MPTGNNKNKTKHKYEQTKLIQAAIGIDEMKMNDAPETARTNTQRKAIFDAARIAVLWPIPPNNLPLIRAFSC